MPDAYVVAPRWRPSALTVVAVVLAALVAGLRLGPFLLGKWWVLGDHQALVAVEHLFGDALRGGALPTWSPELNGGEPFWPVLEALGTADPVVVAVFALASWLGVGSPLAHQWTAVLWLVSLAWGGAACARRLMPSPVMSGVVFVFLLLGPLTTGLGILPLYILPVRYAPWVILTLVRFVEAPSAGRALVLGAMVGVAAAEYQSLYALMFVGLFGVTYTAHARPVITVPLGAVLGYSGLALGGALLIVLPVLLGVWELREHFFLLVRVLEPKVFTWPLDASARGLVVPWPPATLDPRALATSVGPIAGPLVLAALALVILRVSGTLKAWRGRGLGSDDGPCSTRSGSGLALAWLVAALAGVGRRGGGVGADRQRGGQGGGAGASRTPPGAIQLRAAALSVGVLAAGGVVGRGRVRGRGGRGTGARAVAA